MTDWSHLPNAAHIDRILALACSHLKEWVAGGDASWVAGRDAAWTAAKYASMTDARLAAWDAAKIVPWRVVRDAILALIAWDYSAKFLDMTSKELELWQKLSEDPAAILLLPAVRVFEQIKELELE